MKSQMGVKQLSNEREVFEKIASIDWSAYETAYGNAAEDVPDYVPTGETRGYMPKVAQALVDLFSEDCKIALQASHDLWCELCHQHAYLSSAALPAFDILFYALLELEDVIKVELLDIFYGFAVCSSDCDFSWRKQLREKLKEHKAYFQELAEHSNEEISFFAEGIVEALS